MTAVNDAADAVFHAAVVYRPGETDVPLPLRCVVITLGWVVYVVFDVVRHVGLVICSRWGWDNDATDGFGATGLAQVVHSLSAARAPLVIIAVA